MKRLEAVGLICLIASALTGCGKPHYPIPAGTNHLYDGYVVQGGKFGVHIGDTPAQVQATLTRAGNRYDGIDHCASYPKEILGCRTSDTWEIYRVQKLLKDGDIFIKYENGRAVAIAWDFDLINVEV